MWNGNQDILEKEFYSLAHLLVISRSASSSARLMESIICLVDVIPAFKLVLVPGDEPYWSGSNSVK